MKSENVILEKKDVAVQNAIAVAVHAVENFEGRFR
jgi:hypothetical protein